MTKIKVVQHEEKNRQVPVEVMAESIKAISTGIKKLIAGPLNEKALILLIQHATPGIGYSGKPSAKEIRNVLEGIESLEKVYLRKKV